MLIQTQTAPLKAQNSNAATLALSGSSPQPDAGLIAGTLVETENGWQPIELLRAGQYVQTFDGGLRQVRQIERSYYGAAHGGFAIDGVVFIPGGALGNCDDLFAMPEQYLMIESRLAEELLGTPVVLLPASAFVGFYDVEWQHPQGVIEAVTLRFDQEELVYANSGVLLHCPKDAGSDFFTVLDHWRAKALLGLMGSNPWALQEAMRINQVNDSKEKAA